jgi:hypothetical protein
MSCETLFIILSINIDDVNLILLYKFYQLNDRIA